VAGVEACPNQSSIAAKLRGVRKPDPGAESQPEDSVSRIHVINLKRANSYIH